MSEGDDRRPRASAVLRARRDELVRRGRRDARAVAEFLKNEFGATRVWLFGSLAAGSHFRRSSDIDLAVEGLDPDLIFRAVGRALQMAEFDIDIKPFERLPQEWQDRIRKEGEVLV